MTIYGAASADAPLYDEAAREYDALLVLSFGGPEGVDEVMPFLENVARGRNIPRERLEEVAHHYHDFGGISPLNGQNRALIAALEREFAQHGPKLPVYFGNRNWHPLLTDTIRRMTADGVRRALVFVTSAFSSYSGCRQYREDVIRACEAVGEGAPQFDKLRVFYNHPGYIEPMAERARAALDRLPAVVRPTARIIFTAHSIPLGMARSSHYVAELDEACRLVAERLPISGCTLVYQSRSGPPHVPWLEPDICDHLRQIRAEGVDHVVLVPIGFISDHMEVLYDLDTEARQLAAELGMTLVRADTVGTHPAFISMIRELIEERRTDHPVRRALGQRGPSHDICPVNCCLNGERPRPSA